MTNLKKLLLSAVMILTVITSFAVSAGAESTNAAILLTDGTAIVGNGTAGIAVVAKYDENGNLSGITKAAVSEYCKTTVDVEEGDKVFYWRSYKSMEPIAPPVTVTKSDLGDNRDKIYEIAVENALCEALGSDKGENMTDLQKAVALHDWLVMHCTYEKTTLTLDKLDVYSAYGALVNGRALCSGYSKAYNDLLGRVGIEATHVTGEVQGNSYFTQSHGWSCVTIDGKKYHVDVTFDDGGPDRLDTVSHSYFLLSDDALNKSGHSSYTTHCTDTTYESYDMFDYAMQFIWDEVIQKFYYVEFDKVKTTTDFTEKMKSLDEVEGTYSTSCFMTKDRKYIVFFRPSYITSQSTVYLYSIEHDEYYTYTVKDVQNVVFCRVRQVGNNVEVITDTYKDNMPYGTIVRKTISLPTNYEKRHVTFDANYDGGTVSSCYYLNNYWTDGDGSFDAPTRKNVDFCGWYTERNGGVRVESFEEISGDDTVLYAHWWGEWSMTEEPTLTEEGKAVRVSQNNPEITEEVIIPVLSDKSVWTPVSVQSKTETYTLYKSKYGNVQGEVTKIDTTPINNYSITYDSKLDRYVFNWGAYGLHYIKYDIAGQSETISYNVPEGSILDKLLLPESLADLTGTLTITLYDSEMNQLCQAEFEVE